MTIGIIPPDPFDVIYTVAFKSEDGRVQLAHLKDASASWTNIHDPELATVTLRIRGVPDREYKGPIVKLILERFELLGNPAAMAIYRRNVLTDILNGPKKKPGRPKANRDASGAVRNLPKSGKVIRLWNEGKEIEEIDAAINSGPRRPKKIILDQGEIRRKLRRYRHFLTRPYKDSTS